MACGAAVVGALAVAPSIRSVKSYMVATCPPEWAEEYLGAGLGERWWVRLALHLNMVLPLAVLLLWVRPLMEEPLQLTPELMLHLRVGALGFAGLLQVRLITVKLSKHVLFLNSSTTGPPSQRLPWVHVKVAARRLQVFRCWECGAMLSQHLEGGGAWVRVVLVVWRQRVRR